MKFRATLLLPIEDQRHYAGLLIRPDGVTFDADKDYPIFRDFDYKENIGHCRVSRTTGVLSGGLEVAGDLDIDAPVKFVAIGVTVIDSGTIDRKTIVWKSDLMSISTTDDHADSSQPPIMYGED